MKKIKAWHFATYDRRLAYQPWMEVAPGYIYSEDGPIVICESGLHASRKLRDALAYAPGSYLCRVEMWGEVAEEDDKLVARHRHVIAAKDVSAELRLWACWCVRQYWHLLTDDRSRTAVDVAERFARGEATREELAAANAASNAAMWILVMRDADEKPFLSYGQPVIFTSKKQVQQFANYFDVEDITTPKKVTVSA